MTLTFLLPYSIRSVKESEKGWDKAYCLAGLKKSVKDIYCIAMLQITFVLTNNYKPLKKCTL